jgi:hypothetical protein
MLLLSNKFINLNNKFKFFYKYRFEPDYLKFNPNKKKFSKKKSYKWFKLNHKKKIIYKIVLKKKIIGMITYNLDDLLYSIILDKKKRNNKIGTRALYIFLNKMKKQKKKVFTKLNIKNKISIYIHLKIFKSKIIEKKKSFIICRVI